MNAEANIALAEKAFGKQAVVFDEINDRNVIINWMRRQVYRHLNVLKLPAPARILELNAGTGIDACHFARQGHTVLATDVSENMLEQARQKANSAGLWQRLKTERCSFTRLDTLSEKGFDLIFSNFGGLNCTADFNEVGRHFSGVLKPGGHVSLVLISPFCLWEFLLAFKGNFKVAFRRFKKSTDSKVEGLPFTTTYFRPSEIVKSLGPDFRLVSQKSLATFTPPPYLEGRFTNRKGLLKKLNRLDRLAENWPLFRSAGDHFIITLQYLPQI